MKSVHLVSTLLMVGLLLIAGCASAEKPPAVSTTVSPVAVSSSNTSVASPAVSSPPASTAATVSGVQFPYSFTDDAGRKITLNQQPARLVSLSPSNTEMVYALGLGDRLVGNTKYCNYPEAAKNLTKVGGFSDVDIEKVVSVQPDLILAADLHTEKVLPSLEQLGIPVMVLHPITLEGIYNDLNLLGRICGETEKAAGLTAGLKSREEAIRAGSAGMKDNKPRILYVTWHDPIYTAGDNTITGQLIQIAGGVNLAAEVNDYDTITLEQVVDRNPQIIVVMSSMGSNTSIDYINSEPRLKTTDALKNKKVFLVDSDLFGRTTPRIVDALEQLSGLIRSN